MSTVQLVAFLCLAAPPTDSTLTADAAKDYRANLQPLFTWFHQNPELSMREAKTSARLAKELRALGLDVTEKVGGTGLVAVLKNGPGPVILLRADMDGLPLEERSGLPYASKARALSLDGTEQPSMHACGHDTHMTALVGTARQLLKRKDAWRGTVVFIGQPGEERSKGAKAMVDDGLYTRFPKPTVALAFHADAQEEAGVVAVPEGTAYSSMDNLDLKVRGVGTHGAYPHLGVDPVLIAAEIVVALQSMVTRTIDPLEPALISVGAIHGGSKHNIIPEDVMLQLTVRAESREVRQQLLDGIARVANGIAMAHGVASDRLPVLTLRESSPVAANDPELAVRIKAAIAAQLGPERISTAKRKGMGGEDFSYLIEPELGVKGVYMNVGGTPKAELASAAGHHSPLFKISPEPVVTTAVEAMTTAALELLDKRRAGPVSSNPPK